MRPLGKTVVVIAISPALKDEGADKIGSLKSAIAKI
jgi:hypothetical protein